MDADANLSIYLAFVVCLLFYFEEEGDNFLSAEYWYEVISL